MIGGPNRGEESEPVRPFPGSQIRSLDIFTPFPCPNSTHKTELFRSVPPVPPLHSPLHGIFALSLRSPLQRCQYMTISEHLLSPCNNPESKATIPGVGDETHRSP
jgi:hypothetical protein